MQFLPDYDQCHLISHLPEHLSGQQRVDVAQEALVLSHPRLICRIRHLGVGLLPIDLHGWSLNSPIDVPIQLGNTNCWDDLRLPQCEVVMCEFLMGEGWG
jgi:hypothetical protein